MIEQSAIANHWGIDEARLLTPRWTPLRHHPIQARFARWAGRYAVASAGRRSGKSEIAKRRLIALAVRPRVPNMRLVAAAPVRQQAKDLFWQDLKAFLRPEWVKHTSETELSIDLHSHARIEVRGLDEPARIEGSPLDHVLLDEFANMKADAWGAHVEPALNTPGRPPGTADFVGVPEGRNHYYTLAHRAAADTTGMWAHFTWKSADIINPTQIETAKANLDTRTFRQEYEGSFETYAGLVYYAWSDANVRPVRQLYDPTLPLLFLFDFNVAPGVAVVAQELSPPSPIGPDFAPSVTCILGEVWIENNSRTQLVCQRLIDRWRQHRGAIECDGDPAGGARHTSQSGGSDWDIIEREMRGAFGTRASMRRLHSAPAERARVNSLNTRLMTTDGKHHLAVDPSCVHTREDFERVVTKKDGSGEIDKPSGSLWSHLSDSIGYYTARRFPVRMGGFAQTDMTGRVIT